MREFEAHRSPYRYKGSGKYLYNFNVRLDFVGEDGAKVNLTVFRYAVGGEVKQVASIDRLVERAPPVRIPHMPWDLRFDGSAGNRAEFSFVPRGSRRQLGKKLAAKPDVVPRSADERGIWPLKNLPWFKRSSGRRRAGTASPKIDTSRLPATDYTLFGRDPRLQQLADAWRDPTCNLITVVASGGTGKTALVNHWLQNQQHDPQTAWTGADSMFVWSFYHQGDTGEGRVSSESFFVEAFKFFDLPEPGPIPAWDKGRLLADALRHQRAILVLDGLEPLQDALGHYGRVGSLRDQGVLSLLRHLATGHPGLCIVTTRLAASELRSVQPGTHRQIDLEQLDDAAGAELLRHLLSPQDAPRKQKELVARTSAVQLRMASREFAGNALALRLLGNYLAVAYEGDISRRKEVGPLLAEEGEGAHARRVMRAYEQWYFGRPELDILQLLGLFDRPAEPDAVVALRQAPPIDGLTERLHRLDAANWNRVLDHLRKVGLVALEPDTSLSCHPLVREYFGERLRTQNGSAWRTAHARLCMFFSGVPKKEFPDTLAELEPLFRAVGHGCRAEEFEKALALFRDRIRQGEKNISVWRLAAYAADHIALRSFFPINHCEPAEQLSESSRGYVLNELGADLRALGRFEEAKHLIRPAIHIQETQQDWKSLAYSLGNIMQAELATGNIGAALAAGRRNVEVADLSKDAFQKYSKRALLGRVLHSMGQLPAALQIFEEAAQFNPVCSGSLHALQGAFFCKLLLDCGRYCEVVERVRDTLRWSTKHGFRREIALEHVNLGVALAFVDGPHSETAAEAIDRGVDGIRNTGHLQYYPEALIARSAFRRRRARAGDRLAREGAWDDLRIARDLVEYTGQRLAECDALSIAAKLHLDANDLAMARDCVRRIQTIVDDCDYELGRFDLQLLLAWLSVLDGNTVQGRALLQDLVTSAQKVGYRACDEDIQMIPGNV